MNTIAIVRELADERSLTFFKLSQMCDVSHSTLKNSERRGGQLSVDTIERICDGLGSAILDFVENRLHKILHRAGAFGLYGTLRLLIERKCAVVFRYRRIIFDILSDIFRTISQQKIIQIM